jgi:hypothetical protein
VLYPVELRVRARAENKRIRSWQPMSLAIQSPDFREEEGTEFRRSGLIGPPSYEADADAMTHVWYVLHVEYVIN